MDYNYVPDQEEDLVLKKKAFGDLKTFIENAFNPRLKNHPIRKDILFLFGPSGCGKTSAIKYLSKALDPGFDIKDENTITERLIAENEDLDPEFR
jgi:ABC-type Fe3+/spermidine/putrescine transport system ATPase subunit